MEGVWAREPGRRPLIAVIFLGSAFSVSAEAQGELILNQGLVGR